MPIIKDLGGINFGINLQSMNRNTLYRHYHIGKIFPFHNEGSRPNVGTIENISFFVVGVTEPVKGFAHRWP